MHEGLDELTLEKQKCDEEWDPYIYRNSYTDEVLCGKCYITDITDIILSVWLAVMPLDSHCHLR